MTPAPPTPSAAGGKAALLGVLLAWAACSGAACPQHLRGHQFGTMPLPRMLPPHPTLEQIVSAVHDNTHRVRSYMAPQATLSVPGVPRLSAQIACEPPRRFRLRAQTAVTGNELDIGSNDELFWLWIRRHEPKVTLYCRHDRYPEAAARRLLPVRAEWMPELLGLVEFRSEDRHEGPFAMPDGRIEIRSHINSPDGELVRSTLLDGTTGLVAEQHLFSPQGERLASVKTGQYRVEPVSSAALPRQVEVSWPAAGVDFRLDIASIVTNGGSADPGQLWQLPAYEGYEPVDLADPALVGPGPARPLGPAGMPPLPPPVPVPPVTGLPSSQQAVER
jgi:hypothetical protein